MRTVSPSIVCLLINDRVMIQAELTTPLSPGSHSKLQLVNSVKPIPARVELGKYDLERHLFSGCVLSVEVPEAKYERVQYASKKRSNNKISVE